MSKKTEIESDKLAQNRVLFQWRFVHHKILKTVLVFKCVNWAQVISIVGAVTKECTIRAAASLTGINETYDFFETSHLTHKCPTLSYANNLRNYVNMQLKSVITTSVCATPWL